MDSDECPPSKTKGWVWVIVGIVIALVIITIIVVIWVSVSSSNVPGLNAPCSNEKECGLLICDNSTCKLPVGWSCQTTSECGDQKHVSCIAGLCTPKKVRKTDQLDLLSPIGILKKPVNSVVRNSIVGPPGPSGPPKISRSTNKGVTFEDVPEINIETTVITPFGKRESSEIIPYEISENVVLPTEPISVIIPPSDIACTSCQDTCIVPNPVPNPVPDPVYNEWIIILEYIQGKYVPILEMPLSPDLGILLAFHHYKDNLFYVLTTNGIYLFGITNGNISITALIVADLRLAKDFVIFNKYLILLIGKSLHRLCLDTTPISLSQIDQSSDIIGISVSPDGNVMVVSKETKSVTYTLGNSKSTTTNPLVFVGADIAESKSTGNVVVGNKQSLAVVTNGHMKAIVVGGNPINDEHEVHKCFISHDNTFHVVYRHNSHSVIHINCHKENVYYMIREFRQ
jgi:hypothetical protein